MNPTNHLDEIHHSDFVIQHLDSFQHLDVIDPSNHSDVFFHTDVPFSHLDSITYVDHTDVPPATSEPIVNETAEEKLTTKKTTSNTKKNENEKKLDK